MPSPLPHPTPPTAAPAPSTLLDLGWRTGTPEPVPGQGVAGVYVVWRLGRSGPECLVVGEARDIAADLGRTLRECHIAAYAAIGVVEISWAAVASLHRPGIAGWLSAALSPLLAGVTGSARPIEVNLPV